MLMKRRRRLAISQSQTTTRPGIAEPGGWGWQQGRRREARMAVPAEWAERAGLAARACRHGRPTPWASRRRPSRETLSTMCVSCTKTRSARTAWAEAQRPRARAGEPTPLTLTVRSRRLSGPVRGLIWGHHQPGHGGRRRGGGAGGETEAGGGAGAGGGGAGRDRGDGVGWAGPGWEGGQVGGGGCGSADPGGGGRRW